MKAPEQVIDYLVEVLALDPEQGLGRIGELRRDFHAAPKPACPGAEAASAGKSQGGSVDPRTQAAKRINAIREGFWDSDEDATDDAIEGVEADAFPDLKRALNRLRLVNGLRDEVDALEDSPKVRAEHLTALRTILVGTSKEAADARDHVARRLGTDSRSGQLKPLIKTIRGVAPEIAALESEWLVRLRGAKKERKDSRVVGGLGFFGAYGVFLLIRGIVRLVTEWMDKS